MAQLIESDRRRRYAQRVATSDPRPKVLGADVADFDPLYAAVYERDRGEFDEACWLVLLATHFGFNRARRWALAGNFYRQLGGDEVWTWQAARADPAGLRVWLRDHEAELRRAGGGFGNHRKYESLSGTSANGTGEVLESYIAWIGGSHHDRFDPLVIAGDPPRSFAAIYTSLAAVHRFGRIAKFDYLTMMGKLGLLEVVPDKLYLQGASGPLTGARLLWCGTATSTDSARSLEPQLQGVGDALELTYDVLEDALCNWQKSRFRFVSFRG
ncbi:alpha-glutamyl/putrescinyl thymine pyrophosphorylase clade 3 protein [Gordonia sputi]